MTVRALVQHQRPHFLVSKLSLCPSEFSMALFIKPMDCHFHLNLHCVCTCIYACAHRYVCIHLPVYALRYICVWRPEVDTGYFLNSSPPCFSGRLSWNLELTDWLEWLASKLHRVFWLLLLLLTSTGIASVQPMARSFCEAPNSGSLRLYRRRFTSWGIFLGGLPSPQMHGFDLGLQMILVFR